MSQQLVAELRRALAGRRLRARQRGSELAIGGVGEDVADLTHTHRRLLARGWRHEDAVEFLADGLAGARARRFDAVPTDRVRWKLADPDRQRPPLTMPTTGGLVAHPVLDGLDHTERLTGQQILDLGGVEQLFHRTIGATLAEPVRRRRHHWERFAGTWVSGDVYAASRLIDLPALLALVQIQTGPCIVAAPTHQDLWFVPVPPRTDWREAAWAVTAAQTARVAETGDTLLDGAWRLEPDRSLVRVSRREGADVTILDDAGSA